MDAEPKKVLHDGEKQVTKVSVFGMFRNNSEFLDYMFKQFSSMEDYYDVAFSYYFIENDSTDDTRQKLKQWFASGKRGKLICGRLVKDYENRGENLDRTMTLARLRNTLANKATPLDSEWTIFLDSNIFFPVNILERMLAIAPASNNIGMIAPYTNQVFYAGQLRRMGLQMSAELDDKSKVDLMHAYDTYTLVDMDGVNHFPVCPFKKCKMCSMNRTNYPHKLISQDQELVEVRSCFNGFALIESSIINHPRIRWDTLPFDNTCEKTLCDHVLFCDRLRTVTGKKIVMMQHLADVYRTY